MNIRFLLFSILVPLSLSPMQHSGPYPGMYRSEDRGLFDEALCAPQVVDDFNAARGQLLNPRSNNYQILNAVERLNLLADKGCVPAMIWSGEIAKSQGQADRQDWYFKKAFPFKHPRAILENAYSQMLLAHFPWQISSQSYYQEQELSGPLEALKKLLDQKNRECISRKTAERIRKAFNEKVIGNHADLSDVHRIEKEMVENTLTDFLEKDRSSEVSAENNVGVDLRNESPHQDSIEITSAEKDVTEVVGGDISSSEETGCVVEAIKPHSTQATLSDDEFPALTKSYPSAKKTDVVQRPKPQWPAVKKQGSVKSKISAMPKPKQPVSIKKPESKREQTSGQRIDVFLNLEGDVSPNNDELVAREEENSLEMMGHEDEPSKDINELSQVNMPTALVQQKVDEKPQFSPQKDVVSLTNEEPEKVNAPIKPKSNGHEFLKLKSFIVQKKPTLTQKDEKLFFKEFELLLASENIKPVSRVIEKLTSIDCKAVSLNALYTLAQLLCNHDTELACHFFNEAEKKIEVLQDPHGSGLKLFYTSGAFQALDHASATNPTAAAALARALYFRGEIGYKVNEISQDSLMAIALAYYEKTSLHQQVEDKNVCDLRMEYADCLRQNDKLDLAAIQYEILRKFDHPEAYYWLGSLLSAKNIYVDEKYDISAVECYQRAIELWLGCGQKISEVDKVSYINEVYAYVKDINRTNEVSKLRKGFLKTLKSLGEKSKIDQVKHNLAFYTLGEINSKIKKHEQNNPGYSCFLKGLEKAAAPGSLANSLQEFVGSLNKEYFRAAFEIFKLSSHLNFDGQSILDMVAYLKSCLDPCFVNQQAFDENKDYIDEVLQEISHRSEIGYEYRYLLANYQLMHFLRSSDASLLERALDNLMQAGNELDEAYGDKKFCGIESDFKNRIIEGYLIVQNLDQVYAKAEVLECAEILPQLCKIAGDIHNNFIKRAKFIGDPDHHVEQAIQWYTKLDSSHDQSVESKSIRIKLYLSIGKYYYLNTKEKEKAINYFDKACLISDANLLPYLIRGEFYITYPDSVEMKPKAFQMYVKKGTSDLRKVYEESTDENNKAKAACYLGQVEIATNKKNVAKALEYFDSALKGNDVDDLKSLREIYLYRLKNIGKAIECTKKITELDNDYPRMNLYLLQYQYAQQQSQPRDTQLYNAIYQNVRNIAQDSPENKVLANLVLAAMTETGYGCKQDGNKALEYLNEFTLAIKDCSETTFKQLFASGVNMLAGFEEYKCDFEYTKALLHCYIYMFSRFKNVEDEEIKLLLNETALLDKAKGLLKNVDNPDFAFDKNDFIVKVSSIYIKCNELMKMAAFNNNIIESLLKRELLNLLQVNNQVFTKDFNDAELRRTIFSLNLCIVKNFNENPMTEKFVDVICNGLVKLKAHDSLNFSNHTKTSP